MVLTVSLERQPSRTRLFEPVLDFRALPTYTSSLKPPLPLRKNEIHPFETRCEVRVVPVPASAVTLGKAPSRRSRITTTAGSIIGASRNPQRLLLLHFSQTRSVALDRGTTDCQV